MPLADHSHIHHQHEHKGIAERIKEETGEHSHHNHKLHDLMLKSGIAASGVIVAPYIGDALKLSSTSVHDIMHSLHGGGYGTGLAGGINSMLASVPVIGETLAEGGIATAGTSGLIGIGGVLLGNYIEKHRKDEDKDKPNWGKIIKYAALTTSALIALPSILTGLSVGISYIASLAGAEAAASAIGAVSGTIGAIGEMNHMSAAGGIGSMLTHIITCGGAALSVTGAIYADNKYEHEHDKPHIHGNNDHGITTEIVGNPNINKDEQCSVKLRIRDKNGKNLTADDLIITHEKKLHFLIVDNSLNDYHHIHPEYDSKTGLFVASFTPNIQGEYNVWSNFRLAENGSYIITKNKIPALRDHKIVPSIQHNNFVENDSVSLEIKAEPPLTAGADSHLAVRIKNKGKSPIKLDTIMGEYAHLVAFSKDGGDFIHCHPMGNESEINKNGQENSLKFHVAPQKEGFTKFFLQMKINGKETTIPFGQYIRPTQKLAERETMRSSRSNDSFPAVVTV